MLRKLSFGFMFPFRFPPSLENTSSQTSLSGIMIRQKSGYLLVFRLHRTGQAVGLMGEAPRVVSKHVALK